MKLEIRKAARTKSKLRIGIFGPSGSGKTYSSLLLAHGLTGDWSKIALIDTERGSGDLYDSLGDYNVVPLEAPFTPERYIEAINLCVSSGMEAIIIDSISHEWEGSGGILEIKDLMAGNSYTNWSKLTPRHNKFIDSITRSPVHMICCGRSKQEYVLNEVEKNGRKTQVPEKVGMKAVTRDNFDYEMTVAFDLNIHHLAATSKDRTSLFSGKPEHIISEETGRQLLEWVNAAKEPVSSHHLVSIIKIQKIHKLSNEDLAKACQVSTLKGLSESELLDALKRLEVFIESGEIGCSIPVESAWARQAKQAHKPPEILDILEIQRKANLSDEELSAWSGFDTDKELSDMDAIRAYCNLREGLGMPEPPEMQYCGE